MGRQERGPREHVRLMIVHAKPCPPGVEEKLLSVDARELELVFESVCEKEEN